MDSHHSMDNPADLQAMVNSISRKCDATNRAGNPCGNKASPGTNVCHMHGAKAPQVQAKAAERLALVRDLALEKLFARIGGDGDDMDPKVLLETVVKVGAQIELLEGRATTRSEAMSQERAAEAKERLQATLDELAERRAQRPG